jgi:hypothetical protein
MKKKSLMKPFCQLYAFTGHRMVRRLTFGGVQWARNTAQDAGLFGCTTGYPCAYSLRAFMAAPARLRADAKKYWEGKQ